MHTYTYIGHTNWLHGNDDDAAMVPAYQEFVGLLFEPSAAPLLGMVESFLQALLNKNPKMTDYAMVHNFLGAMENPFRSHRCLCVCLCLFVCVCVCVCVSE